MRLPREVRKTCQHLRLPGALHASVAVRVPWPFRLRRVLRDRLGSHRPRGPCPRKVLRIVYGAY